MITIIDYGLGNLTSVANALKKLSIPYLISGQTVDLAEASGLILPGVGAAGEGMKNLKARGLDKLIATQIVAGKPILGICLGMQLLFSRSDEGDVECLNLIKGGVKRFETTRLKVPQIGWNQVAIKPESRLLKGIKNNECFYFVHSYYCDPQDQDVVTGMTNYSQDFCSVIETENIYGVQFHPEKSGEVGLQLLQSFWKLI